MMSTEPGGLVETSDDGTLLPFIDLDRRRQGRLRKLVDVTFAFDVREHVLAGDGHFANVQVPDNVNPLLASARGSQKPCPEPVSALTALAVAPVRMCCDGPPSRSSARDLDGDALRRALRAAIVVPIAGIVGYSVAGLSQTALFTLLGAIWLLGLIDLPGNRRVRAPGYCSLGFNGAVLITIGTLVEPFPWFAVALTFVLCGGDAACSVRRSRRVDVLRCCCMCFRCARPPLRSPRGCWGGLLRWPFACRRRCSCFPPPPQRSARSRRAGIMALADRLDGVGSGDEVSSAMSALEKNFMSADYRPVGLTVGSRALVRVVEDLKWLTDRVGNDDDVGPADLQAPVVAVLRCCARTLNAGSCPQRPSTGRNWTPDWPNCVPWRGDATARTSALMFAAEDDEDAMVLGGDCFGAARSRRRST